MNGGPFIVFEGGDGAGKTEQAARLFNELKLRGYPVHGEKPEREPHDAAIRKQLLNGVSSPLEELRLFLLDRELHVTQVIRPAINAGKIVICDRFSPSTFAYQHFGRGMDLDTIRHGDTQARRGTWPDIIFLLDGNPAVFRQRLAERGEKLTAFEMLGLEFHQRVRSGFLAQVDPESLVWHVINAEQEKDTVFESVLRSTLQHPFFKPESITNV